MMNDKDRLIYANELIEEIDEIIGNINFSSPYQNDNRLIVEGLERARDCVLDSCTVDAVEIVHGQWIRKPIGKYTGVDEVCCSVCGCFIGVVASDTAFIEAIEGMNYCPNCGAKMDLK